MSPDIVLRALLAIWDELPELVGDDWPSVLPDLKVLFDRLEATNDPDVTTEIVLLLRRYPEARARLQAAAADLDRVGGGDNAEFEDETDGSAARAPAPGPDRTPSIRPVIRARSAGAGAATRRRGRWRRRRRRRLRRTLAGGVGRGWAHERPGRPGSRRGAASPSTPTATCHVRAEMDQTLVVDRTASIEVIVSREAVGGPIHEAAAEGAAEVDPGRRLIIQVLPKASVEVVGESQIEIDIPATGQPTTVYFDLRPTIRARRASGSWRARVESRS